ncbi:MAG: alpha/beta hydrolase [Nitriliruptor sp.]|nr:MAG: alpha/beta hydrolase [Nitriliruptor sp.]
MTSPPDLTRAGDVLIRRMVDREPLWKQQRGGAHMTPTQVRTEAATLSHTTSPDGTRIGYFTTGEGPPLVLVHGGLGDHTRWSELLPELEPHRTVHAMDRRGRGASGDGPEYAAQREFEDVAAVVDAVAEDAGAGVDVYGVSNGATFALGAATLTSNVRRLALYEPGIADADELVPPELEARMDALLASGDNEGLVETFFRAALGLGDDDIATIRAQPSWPARVAVAPTLPRELRHTPEQLFDPAQAAEVAVPTLLLQGSESPEILHEDVQRVAQVVPDSRIVILEGQAHSADFLAPQLVAEQLLAFLRETH